MGNVIDMNGWKEDKAVDELTDKFLDAAEILIENDNPTYAMDKIINIIINHDNCNAAYILMETIKALDYDFYLDMVLDDRMEFVANSISEWLTDEVEKRENKPDNGDEST